MAPFRASVSPWPPSGFAPGIHKQEPACFRREKQHLQSHFKPYSTSNHHVLGIDQLPSCDCHRAKHFAFCAGFPIGKRGLIIVPVSQGCWEGSEDSARRLTGEAALAYVTGPWAKPLSHLQTFVPLLVKEGQDPEPPSVCWLSTFRFLAVNAPSFLCAPGPGGGWMLPIVTVSWTALVFPFCSCSPFHTSEINSCVKSPQSEVSGAGFDLCLPNSGAGSPQLASLCIPAIS